MPLRSHLVKRHTFTGLLIAGLIGLILWQLGKWSMPALYALIGLAILGFVYPPAAIVIGLLALAYLLLPNVSVLANKWFGVFKTQKTKSGGTKG